MNRLDSLRYLQRESRQEMRPVSSEGTNYREIASFRMAKRHSDW